MTSGTEPCNVRNAGVSTTLRNYLAYNYNYYIHVGGAKEGVAW